MAYPVDQRGLDPHMQRIIEASGASGDDDLFQPAPFSRPSIPAPPPPTFSRHFNNGSSLQDMFAYQASPTASSSLSRQPAQPLQPTQQEYHIQQPYTGAVYTPPGQRSSSPELSLSSPTRRIVANRETRLTLPSSRHSKESTSFQSVRTTLTNADVPHDPAESAHPTHQTPPVINGIQLISTRDLPDRFRPVFPFPLFNAIQSKVFPAVYGTNDNVVVSAPTGGGKTAILELAIVKLVETHTSGQFKIVYQAPTKSLCSERARDWTAKFGAMNIATAELTGDTDATELRKVGNATIIVTTPEKWDSITRKWKDHVKLLQLVKLFLIDEVHILKEDRGATLEAVVSRMKSIGANVRFVALSATVPNSHDIALWLGRDHTNSHLPAHRETFGEEFRPVKLQKHVHGFDSSGNDYAFDSALTSKLPALIAKYTHKKPMMVFCFTRKSCETTAAKLAEWWGSLRPTDRAWPAPTERVPVTNKDLHDLVSKGVAYHHAGLDPGDRMAVEKGYLKGQLNVICCTSTLAVGVNLPCHLVVLKGTVGYQNGQLAEYSDLEVMQMLGRAGRPQFDDSAVAIIMTSKPNVDRYTKMISGQDVLESTLHLNLIEHLNSEIGLGTVRDLYSAKTWLGGTFLSVRMKQNPRYYKFSCDSGTRDPDERLESVCERDIKLLQETKLITSDNRFTCTQYGEAMSKYMVKFETMQLLLSIPEHAKMSQILDAVSLASEFKDLKMKAGERAYFRELNKSSFLKWPIKEVVTTAAHKISLIVQVQLGGIDLPNEKDFNRRQYLTEQGLVFDRIQRLVRCVVDCKAYDRDAVATQNALELSRSISAQYWEHLPNQLRQIPNIGAAAVRKLVGAGLSSIDKLIASDSSSIERTMSRNPPYGHKLLESLKEFPRLTLKADVVGRIVKAGQAPQVKIRVSMGMSNQRVPYWRKQNISLTFMAGVSNGNLAHFWRGNMKKLEKGFELHFIVNLLSPSDAISCFLACDDIVGTVKSVILAHDIPQSAFPPPQPAKKDCSKPLQSIETDEDFYYEDGFDWDGITDKELRDGVEAAKAKPTEKLSEANEDDFMDIEDILPKASVADSIESTQRAEPVQLPNGRWMCNHACSDGQKTKSGGNCKHKCCRDGLDKPRKAPAPKKPKSKGEITTLGSMMGKQSAPLEKDPESDKLNFSRPESEYASLGRIDVLDLSQVLDPIPYEDIAPREYRKLHALHSQTAAGEPVPTLRKIKPTANYGSGARPFMTYMQGVNQEKLQPVAKMIPDRDGSSGTSNERNIMQSRIPPSGWMSLDDDEEEIDKPSPAKHGSNDRSVVEGPSDPAYPGFTADLMEGGSSYMAYGSLPEEDYHQDEHRYEPQEQATSNFMNGLVDYEAYSTAEPSTSSHTLSLSPAEAVLGRKRALDSVGLDEASHKKSRISGGEEGSIIRDGFGLEIVMPVNRPEQPRPKWVDEMARLHPQFAYLLDSPYFEWESDEQAEAAKKLKAPQ